MLHMRRQRLKAMAEREERGESFWSERFPDVVRTKIQYAFEDSVRSPDGRAVRLARDLILRDEGLPVLCLGEHDPYSDMIMFLLRCPHEMVPTVIEALYLGIKNDPEGVSRSGSTGYVRTIRTILREHRISFDFVDGEVVPFSSLEMHQSVVEPSLRLLANCKRYAQVEAAYRAALHEIAEGVPSDAITDAGTALQEMLTTLGCSGNALGPLIKSARAKGLLLAHDGAITDSIVKALDWVSADRSQLGDAHNVRGPSTSDAWLTVHIVGALIVRLADEEARGG